MLVSSGAVGVGCCKMGLKNRPSKIAQKQAVSAVGQIHLMRYYQDFFEALGLVCNLSFAQCSAWHSNSARSIMCMWFTAQKPFYSQQYVLLCHHIDDEF